MKKLFTIFLLIISSKVFATHYYVRTDGNNSNNGLTDNAIGAFATYEYATTVATVQGDVIHIGAGNFTQTTVANLAVGVSIEGAGYLNTTISTSINTGSSLVLQSGSYNTAGNQHINGFSYEGNNVATSAIMVQMRGRVEISYCRFTNFFHEGVIFRGGQTFGDMIIIYTNGLQNFGLRPGVTRAVGNSFHHNIMNNCAEHAGGNAFGSLTYAVQDSFYIYNNDIRNNTRGGQLDGEPIKFDPAFWGFNRYTKIYNNVLKARTQTDFNHANVHFDFAIELGYEKELEIYNNDIEGSVDNNWLYKETNYSMYIHDNKIRTKEYYTEGYAAGIVLEFDVFDAIVENNTIDSVMQGIYFSVRNNCYIKNVTVRNNKITNAGQNIVYNNPNGMLIGAYVDATGVNYENILIDHNTAVACQAGGVVKPQYGMCFQGADTINNLTVRNNILNGVITDQTLMVKPIAIVTNSTFANNVTYGGNYDAIFSNWQGTLTLPAGQGNVFSGNWEGTQNPNFNANYEVQNPALINAGTDGLTVGYNSGAGGGNLAPTVTATATPNTMQLPANSSLLEAIGNDADGTIVSYVWSVQSGPGGSSFTSGNSSTTSVTELSAGTYIFRCTVTDNTGATGYVDVTVTVTAAPPPPVEGIKYYRKLKM